MYSHSAADGRSGKSRRYRTLVYLSMALLLGCAGRGGGESAEVETPASGAREVPEGSSGSDEAALTRAEGPAMPRARAAPGGDARREALAEAYRTLRGLEEGKNADYIPALAKVDPKLYGIALATVEGAVYEVGDVRSEFSIQSVSKIFTLASAIDQLGAEAVEDRIGVNATGMPFNSIVAIELNKEAHAAGNPLVNAGAISTVALLSGEGAHKWNAILGSHSAFAARQLAVNDEVYRSETETNTRNRAIATLMQAYEVVKGDPMEALDLYTRQCSINVTARDLAIMGATLANGGRNPLTGQQVVRPESVRHVLSVMATAGLYETTGEWMYRVGVPAKSGVGGGIVAVVPGRFAIGTFSPPLDEAGNSVRGQRAIATIVQRLGANVFASRPRGRPAAPGAAVPSPQGRRAIVTAQEGSAVAP